MTNVESAEKVMTKKVITCTSTDTLLQVQQLMVNNNISRVVIVDENKPVGIITRRDVINFLVADKSKRGIEEIKAEEVMTKKLITAKRKTPISNIAETMAKKDISSVIIVDGKGKLGGIVTKSDITAWYGAVKGAYKVQEFMTAKPVTVKPSQSVFLVASLMAEHAISRVIVVADKENKPAGIITEADMTMMSKLLKPAKVLKEGKPLVVRGAIALPKSVHLLTARDIMTSDLLTIRKSADLADAAELMTKHKISGLPVTDKGKLVGIITKSDIIRAVAHEK
ncbi:MAG TPA: CBS domain-containing protein [Candidatus Bathyarchaeia archaeon]|nr:CBS domain-containing protein [Candidatus Bathyarchaeia archaeon]